MTEATESQNCVDPTPPPDYGNGTEWAPDGDFYVPPDLRPFYAAAEPHPQNVRGYVTSGVSTSRDVETTVDRLVAPGRDDSEPVVVQETRVAPTLVDLAGPSGYPLWLHLERMCVAARDKEQAERVAVMERSWHTCSVCGERSSAVQPLAVWLANYHERVYVVSCHACRSALQAEAREALARQAADRRLPDGRRVGDVAASVVADLLRTDGAA